MMLFVDIFAAFILEFGEWSSVATKNLPKMSFLCGFLVCASLLYSQPLRMQYADTEITEMSNV